VISHADTELARLREAHPDWEIWVVNRVVGGPLWCAKRQDWQPGGVILNEDSAEHLAEALAEQAGQ
jgi:hypothetical protein